VENIHEVFISFVAEITVEVEFGGCDGEDEVFVVEEVFYSFVLD